MTGADDVRRKFNKFAKENDAHIRREVTRRLYSREVQNDADDMVQQVLLKLYKNFANLPANEHQRRKYINNTVATVCIDFSRRKWKRNEQLVEVQDGDDYDQAIDRDRINIADDRELRRVEARLIIDHCLSGVSTEQREALFLSAEGWTAAEIAERQNVCVNTAKTRAFYGRQKARAALAKADAFEYAPELEAMPLTFIEVPAAPWCGDQLTFFDVLGVTPIAERRASRKTRK